MPSAIAAVIADDALVLLGELDQRVGEDDLVLRRARACSGRNAPDSTSNGADAVVLEGILLRRLVAVALRGERVHEDRAVAVREHRVHVLEGLEQHVDAVALRSGPTYLKPSASKSRPGEKKTLSDSSAFCAQWSMSPGSEPRNSFAQPFMRRTIGAESLRERYDESAPTFGEIDISLSFSTTTRLRCCRCAGVVQRLERHARGHAAVADQRDRAAVLAAVLEGARHAERRGDRGAGVAGAEVVVGRLGAAQELPDAALLADAARSPSRRPVSILCA